MPYAPKGSKRTRKYYFCTKCQQRPNFKGHEIMCMPNVASLLLGRVVHSNFNDFKDEIFINIYVCYMKHRHFCEHCMLNFIFFLKQPNKTFKRIFCYFTFYSPFPMTSKSLKSPKSSIC